MLPLQFLIITEVNNNKKVYNAHIVISRELEVRLKLITYFNISYKAQAPCSLGAAARMYNYVYFTGLFNLKEPPSN